MKEPQASGTPGSGTQGSGPGADNYQTLFERSADAILIIEGDKFVDCNRAAVDMLRAENKSRVLQTHPSELSPEFQPDGKTSFDKANEMMAIALDKGSHRFEWDHKRVDGDIFPVEVLLTAIPTEAGYTLHTVWRDISERKQLETELRHAQKMEAIGRLAGGIAHDFNNQLVPILGYADLLKDELQGQGNLLELLEPISQAGGRAKALVDRIMVFSHKEVRQTQTVDLQETVRSLLAMVIQLIGEDIHFRFDPGAAEVLPVELDPGDIEQVILNLVTNARDAMPTGGEISLNLSRIECEGRDFARLEIQDTGHGMDGQTRAQVFEPFFTTKGVGSGTGLGLSTVLSVVTHAGGDIDVTSETGQGACFEVLLPLSVSPFPASLEGSKAQVSRSSHASAGSTRILVAEDNDDVASLIDAVLSRNEFEVTVVNSAEVALQVALTGTFDLIISDVILPGMNGPQMIRELEKEGVAPPVLFISGYTDDRLRDFDFDTKTVSMLRKPFTAAELLNEIYQTQQQ